MQMILQKFTRGSLFSTHSAYYFVTGNVTQILCIDNTFCKCIVENLKGVLPFFLKQTKRTKKKTLKEYETAT